MPAMPVGRCEGLGDLRKGLGDLRPDHGVEAPPVIVRGVAFSMVEM